MTSGRDQKELTGVSLLGNKTKYPTDYAPEVLEAFINKQDVYKRQPVAKAPFWTVSDAEMRKPG